MTSVGLLQANLSELYAVVHTPELSKEGLPLTVLYSNRLVYSESLLARATKMFFGEADLQNVCTAVHFTLNSLFNESVHKAYQAHQRRVICWIKTIRNESLSKESIQELSKSYFEYLSKSFGKNEADFPIIKDYMKLFEASIESQPLKGHEVVEIRCRVTNVSQATRPFWRLILTKVDNLCVHLRGLIHDNSLLKNQTFYKSYCHAQYLIDFEGILETDIPFNLLAKIKDHESFSTVEKVTLKDWITAINCKKAEILSKKFLSLLKEIVEIIRIAGKQVVTLVDLVVHLDKLGCEIFSEEDADHLDWRDGLRTGDEFTCNGKPFKLGTELAPSTVLNDQFRVFNVANPECEGLVVKFGVNRFISILEAHKIAQYSEHWGVRPVVIHEIDNEQTCVFVERLTGFLHENVWTSTDAILTEADQSKALIIANHILHWQKCERIPESLESKYFAFDKDGILKSSHLLKEVPFNYMTVENFCCSVARGNQYVLDFLMHVSGLNTHPIATFFREGVKFSFERGKTDLLSRQLPEKYDLPEHNAHIDQLCTQAIKQKEGIIRSLNHQFRREKRQPYKGKEQQLLHEVGQKLSKLYASSSTPGRLQLDVQSKIIKDFSQSKEDEKEKASLLGREEYVLAYYLQNVDMMNQMNGAVEEESDRGDFKEEKKGS